MICVAIMFSSRFNRLTEHRSKHVKFLNHLNFLQNCKKNKVISYFMQLKYSVSRSVWISNSLNSSHFTISSACIHVVQHFISKIAEEIYDLHLFNLSLRVMPCNELMIRLLFNKMLKSYLSVLSFFWRFSRYL